MIITIFAESLKKKLECRQNNTVNDTALHMLCPCLLSIYPSRQQAQENRIPVAIGISRSGRSVDIVHALKISRMSGATTIRVTNHDTSPITEVSDICLYTQSEETQHSILAMSSRIAQLTIFDAIYTYIVANKNSGALEAILGTEAGLKEKRY